MSCGCEEKENRELDRLTNLLDYMVTRLKDIEGRLSSMGTYNNNVLNQLNAALGEIHTRLKALEGNIDEQPPAP